MKQSFNFYRDKFCNIIEHNLEQILQKDYNNTSKLYDALQYVCLNGGKRIRPLLVYLAGDWYDIDNIQLEKIASSVELIHCYSLVHDDLPAMDNDDIRRGKPTCHIAFDEGIAILTGDALQSLAFEIIADDQNLSEKTRIKLVLALSKACGHNGMAGGQALDLEATNKDIDIDKLTLIHKLKTQALLVCCADLVSIIANEENSSKGKALSEFARLIGLAFQIKDDILESENTTESLGKSNKSDLINKKNTFCNNLGIKKSKKMLDDLHKKSIALLKPWGSKSEMLIDFAAYLLNRNY